MGTIERRQRHKDEVKKDIICAAWQIVKSDGWQSLSIRKIADAIEYSVPVIYDHFENKEAILKEFSKEGYRILSQKMVDVKTQYPDPADQIMAMSGVYWDFAMNYKEHYQLMFGIGMPCCVGSQCSVHQSNLTDILMEPIEAMIEKSGRDVNACLKYHTYWSVMHGLVSIKITGNSVADDELNKMVLDDAIGGFIKNLR